MLVAIQKRSRRAAMSAASQSAGGCTPTGKAASSTHLAPAMCVLVAAAMRAVVSRSSWPESSSTAWRPALYDRPPITSVTVSTTST